MSTEYGQPCIMLGKHKEFGVAEIGKILKPHEEAVCHDRDATFSLHVYKNPKDGAKPARVVPEGDIRTARTALCTARAFLPTLSCIFHIFSGWQGHGGLRGKHTTTEASTPSSSPMVVVAAHAPCQGRAVGRGRRGCRTLWYGRSTEEPSAPQGGARHPWQLSAIATAIATWLGALSRSHGTRAHHKGGANSGEVQKTAQGERKGCTRTWKTNAPRAHRVVHRAHRACVSLPIYTNCGLSEEGFDYPRGYSLPSVLGAYRHMAWGGVDPCNALALGLRETNRHTTWSRALRSFVLR